jgi:excisionase family DNA binding protein
MVRVQRQLLANQPSALAASTFEQINGGFTALCTSVSSLPTPLAPRTRKVAVLLKPSEVAERLRCGLKTVYSLLESGRLIGSRCPGWRIAEEDLEVYIERGRHGRRHAPWPEKTKPIKLKHLR